MAKKKPIVSEGISEYLRSIGRKGGAAKVPKGLASVTPEKMAEIRAKGLATRQKKAKKKRGAK